MSITFQGYIKKALRTYSPSGKGLEHEALVFSLGLMGEAGEVADIVKKHIGHGHELDKEALKKELGDVLWYVVALAHVCGLDDDISGYKWRNPTQEKIGIAFAARELCMASANASSWAKRLINKETRDRISIPRYLYGDLRMVILYAGLIADEISTVSESVTIADIASLNVEKLSKRYPDGFSHEASINRGKL